MNIGKIIVQAFLGVAFLVTGGVKLAGVPQIQDEFTRYHYPQWFRVVTGTVEVTGAVGMLGGFFRPVLTRFAAFLLLTTMIGAILTHLRIKDPVRTMLVPLVLGTFASIHVLGNRRIAPLTSE